MARLIDRLRARPSLRADPVTMEEFGYLLGRQSGETKTSAGVAVGRGRMLGVAAWFSGVRYIAETVASLPVHTYRDRVGNRERRADPPWLRRPDVEQVWFGLVEHWMMSLLHAGNAYAFKVRSPTGQVIGLRELHPDRVTPGVAPDGTKRFAVDRSERIYTTREVLHIPGLAYDGRVGMNPIRATSPALGGVVAGEDYASLFYGRSTHVGGVITIPEDLTSDQAAEKLAEWERFHQGLRHAHQTGLLSGGASYQPLALNAEDAQLLQSRQWGVTEIARVLRLPPHKLYDLTRATFSNIEHQSIEAITDGIQPWVERLEAWVNADLDLLPSGNFIEFELEGRLRGDTSARYAAYQTAVGVPWMSVNEARRLENLPALASGDEVALPLNMAGGSTSEVVAA